MKITIKNKQYELDFAYPNDDTTTGEIVLVTDGFRETWPKIATVEKKRYHLDKPVSKAKRRTYVVKALLGKLKLDKATRIGVWEQLWQQMRVPS